jgi:Glycosyltransferase family 87
VAHVTSTHDSIRTLPTFQRGSGRVVRRTLVGVLWVFVLYGLVLGVQRVQPTDFGADQRFYAGLGQRFLETGALYGPEQLQGPYDLLFQRDNTYPPTALLLLVPAALAPAVTWWLVPLAVLGFALYRWRPRWWAWAGLALLALWPRTIGAVLFGNSDMWMAAAVAGGLLWGWPGLLLLIKPTLAPLASLGARRANWWLGAGGMVVLSILMLPLWQQYLQVLRDARGLGIDYSLGSLPFVFAPTIAWLGRTRGSR